MAKDALYTFVAGGALEQGVVFNVKCNCGGNAPITPEQVAGYGYGKKGGAMKIVDQMESICDSCGTPIKISVIEGDPGYVLTSTGGVEALLLPQGSTSIPVAALSQEDRGVIIDQMKKEFENEKKKKKPE